MVKCDYIRIFDIFAENVGIMSRRSTTHKIVSGAMTVVRMPPVNVGSCVTAFMQVSADGCKGILGLVRRAWTAGEVGGGRSVGPNVTLWTFYFYEPISRDLSRNLSRENAKP